MTTRPSALILDDDQEVCTLYNRALDSAGFKTESAASIAEAIQKQNSQAFDLILLDLNLGAVHSLEHIPDLLSKSPLTRLWVLTSHGSIELAVNAMKKGASGFFTKDRGVDAVVGELKAAFFSKSSKQDSTLPVTTDDFGLLGVSPQTCTIRQNIQRMKDVSSTVLIYGESGTGKELIAKALHHSSERKKAPFAAVNCGAIPEQLLESELFGHKRGAFTDAKTDHIGFFEKCSDGTLFLDEIAEMPLALQVKLLRVLQEREVSRIGSTQAIKVNTRVIVATNRILEAEVQKGNFREDLYYRLSILRIESSPLRERKADIPILVRAFIDKFAAQFNKQLRYPNEELMAKLVAYHWTGNVRELQNSIERAAVLTQDGNLSLEDLFPKYFSDKEDDADSVLLDSSGSPAPFQAEKLQFEKSYLIKLLKATNGNISEAARISGQHRPQLYRLLHKYSIEPEQYLEKH